MKKYIKFKLLIFIAFLAIMAVSCDENNDPEPIISTDDYPIATFAISPTTVSESGGVVTITITTDKMISRGITFSAEQIGGTAVLHDDYDIVDASIAPFTKEGKIIVKFHDDFVLDADDTLELQITTPSLANRYVLNPTTVLPTYTLVATNYIATNLLVEFNWDQEVKAFVPDEMLDAVFVTLSDDNSEYNLMSMDSIEGEIEFTSPDGFAVMADVAMDFVKIVLPDNLIGIDGLLDYGIGLGLDEDVADFIGNGNVLVAKTLYNTGAQMTSVTAVEKGDLFVYKITRLDVDNNTIVSYGYIKVGDLALLNGIDPILNLEYREGVLPELETTSSVDYVEFDLFVSPASGFDINSPWDNGDESYIGGYGSTLTFDLTGADDGEYVIWSELWWNGYHTILENSEADGELVPITATFSRAGIDFSEDVVQDDSQATTTDQLGDFDYDFDPRKLFGTGSYGGMYTTEETYGIIAKITIANGNYTITDFNDIVIASGKSTKGKAKSKRPLKYMH